jgi:hypothetical protein
MSNDPPPSDWLNFVRKATVTPSLGFGVPRIRKLLGMAQQLQILTLNFNYAGQLSRYCDGLRAGRQGFDPPQRAEVFLCSTASRPALGPSQPPIQRVQWAFSQEVKWSGREAAYSSPSYAQVNNGGAVPPLRHMSPWHGAWLMKQRQLYFHLTPGHPLVH